MVMQESAEMYLETILVLSEEKPRVRSIDVAEYMNFSKPSVSRAVGLLRENGYITVEDDNALLLTEAGRKIATTIYERHRVLTECLEMLGVEEKTAEEDACKIEHVISPESFYAIKTHMERKKNQNP